MKHFVKGFEKRAGKDNYIKMRAQNLDLEGSNFTALLDDSSYNQDTYQQGDLPTESIKKLKKSSNALPNDPHKYFNVSKGSEGGMFIQIGAHQKDKAGRVSPLLIHIPKSMKNKIKSFPKDKIHEFGQFAQGRTFDKSTIDEAFQAASSIHKKEDLLRFGLSAVGLMALGAGGFYLNQKSKQQVDRK